MTTGITTSGRLIDPPFRLKFDNSPEALAVYRGQLKDRADHLFGVR